MLSAQSLIRCAPQAEPESASAPIEPYSTVRYQDQQPETACRRSAQWCTWHGLPSHAGMTGRLGGAYLLSSSTVPVWILRRILLPCLLASGAAVSRRVFERSVSFHSRQNPLPISDVTSRVERGGERSLPRWYIRLYTPPPLQRRHSLPAPSRTPPAHAAQTHRRKHENDTSAYKRALKKITRSLTTTSLAGHGQEEAAPSTAGLVAPNCTPSITRPTDLLTSWPTNEQDQRLPFPYPQPCPQLCFAFYLVSNSKLYFDALPVARGTRTGSSLVASGCLAASACAFYAGAFHTCLSSLPKLAQT